MPMASVPARYAELEPDAEIVVICHHGGRSMQVAMFLERQGFLEADQPRRRRGPVAQQVDPSMPPSIELQRWLAPGPRGGQHTGWRQE